MCVPYYICTIARLFVLLLYRVSWYNIVVDYTTNFDLIFSGNNDIVLRQ